jgi:hypothetical protein
MIKNQELVALGDGVNALLNTELKLKETEYFLKQMKKYYDKDPDFGYNFNAFISTGREVTAYLKRDICHIEDNDKLLSYYCRKIEEMRKDELLKYMADLRVTIEHRENPASSIGILVDDLSPIKVLKKKPRKETVSSILGSRVYLTQAIKGKVTRNLANQPKKFLGKDIRGVDTFKLSEFYYGYLHNFVWDIIKLLPNVEVKRKSDLKVEDFYH